jgi:hypothetical protein
MEDTSKVSYRVQSKTSTFRDLVPPVATGLASYVFLSSRFMFSPVLDIVCFYSAWFLLGMSVLMIFRVFFDLMTSPSV